ncbi:ankyrin repeat domain-containing protein 49-like [Biomphalaria glabrata]|uniref:Ankyrin repeat domain-containing protein 49-like n=1 Tax=Biomphalaria glabrata TaxID=6526 RepID=A0A9W2YMC0_BIOGL|nr:ankyrin repeat domain-containing protein 49-like [Biomphalaria glabrata]XP_055863967.1 ankyrin repeat domain-containing protein 49-like [Biomphalaria glabrata]KAI8795852.1 ankyrin repeat domain-containing protein 49 [Biomphalaria glabrata]
MDNTIDAFDLIGFKESLGSDEQFWKSCNDEEDEDECEEFTEAELANNPDKRILWAAENNRLDVVQEILASEPHLVKTCDSDLYTPLHRASYNNHRDMAELLLSHGADVTSKTADGWQPLHSAARWNSVETAQLLIDAGADVNAQTNGSLTPLHMAASEPENRQMLELLLNCPFIDTSIKSKAGETAREICYRCSPNYKLFDLTDECINMFPTSS